MPNKAVTKSYSNLLIQIKNTIESGRKRIELTKALTYWRIGEGISKHLLNQNNRAGYGAQLYKKLSKDLHIGHRTLERTVQFHREFPIPSARTQLDWTHYRKLITVDDPRLRNRLLAKAKMNKLTTRELASEIRNTTYDLRHTKSASKLTPKRGQLYIYKLIDVDGTLEVDCGFYVTRAIPLNGLKAPKDGDRVISAKTRRGFTFLSFVGIQRDLYTYKAGSLRVVDGDTIACRIDCGFKTKIKRSLRLRGINAPEIKTAAGRASKRFMQKSLKGKSEIIFRSYGVDKHGRYVVDVFVPSPPITERKAMDAPRPKGAGAPTDEYTYLNQELLNAGFAQQY